MAGPARPAPNTYPTADNSGSALRLKEMRIRLAPEEGSGQARPGSEAERGQRPPVQPALFSERDVRHGEHFTSKVISMNSYGVAPERPARKNNTRRTPHRTRIVTGRVHPPTPLPGVPQQTFAFQPDAPREAAAQAEPTRYCDAPVAPVAHRMIAAALDLSMIAVAMGILVLLVHLSPAGEFLNRKTLPYVGGFGVLLGFGYKFLWASADMDSPGTRWAHLKLLNFDGAPPTRGQRIERLLASVLSVLAAGLGLFWALVDEETLSWHDHISKTFASPDLPRY